MKTFWKVLGAAALIAGLTPYKVEKDEETGESSYQALLWRITSGPSEVEGEKRQIGINLGEGTLTSKLLELTEKDEPHLFSDELCVEYTGVPVTEEAPAEPEELAEPVEAEEAEVAEEPEKPEEAEKPEEPEAAAEVPAETPAEAEETKEEA